uniref:Uncharacterized protein n=1 Tax=Anguilla anguilla TaxID=7936 RepID=A0A0E9TFU5_ANGAN
MFCSSKLTFRATSHYKVQ